MRNPWALLPLLLTGACEPPPRAIRIDLIPSGSCGQTALPYDISCVEAVEVKVIDANGTEVGSKCTVITDRGYTSIDAIISGEFLPVLEDVKARPSSKVELRAYHAFNKLACTDQIFDELMMWGSSDFVDFSDPSVEVVNVTIECRPGCDCAQQKDDAAACPAALVRGVCTLNKVFTCRRPCTEPGDCLLPELVCYDSVCTPTGSRATCADCTSASDCDGERCILNTNRSESFCSLPCPALDNVDPCPGRMSCVKIDGTIFVEQP